MSKNYSQQYNGKDSIYDEAEDFESEMMNDVQYHDAGGCHAYRLATTEHGVQSFPLHSYGAHDLVQRIQNVLADSRPEKRDGVHRSRHGSGAGDDQSAVKRKVMEMRTEEGDGSEDEPAFLAFVVVRDRSAHQYDWLHDVALQYFRWGPEVGWNDAGKRLSI